MLASFRPMALSFYLDWPCASFVRIAQGLQAGPCGGFRYPDALGKFRNPSATVLNPAKLPVLICGPFVQGSATSGGSAHDLLDQQAFVIVQGAGASDPVEQFKNKRLGIGG